MTAKRAAEALYLYDTDLKDSIDTLNDSEDYWWISEGGSEKGLAILKNCMGTWTLTMVAHASGQTEQAVLAALYKNYLKGGTQCVVTGEVRALYRVNE